MKPLIMLLPVAGLMAASAADAATVLITGSDRGLGLEFVREYAARGDTVIATCRHPDRATDLRALAARDKNVIIEKLDVGNDTEIKSLSAKYQGRAIDVLINNAGVFGRREDQTLGTFSRKAFHEVMDTNTFGALAVSEAFRANVLVGGQKKIIAITGGAASFAATPPYPGVSPYFYSISEAALNMAMAALGAELKSQNVIVALVSPGGVDTDMFRSFATAYKVEMRAISKEESVSKMIGVIEHLDQTKASQGVNNYDGTIDRW